MKTRKEKDADIDVLQEEFGQKPNALIVGFQGLKVENDEKLRRELRESNIQYRVVKNTLAIRAAKGTPVEQIREHFSGPTAIALSKDDPVSLAKILSKWAKESTVFKFKAGIVEGRAIEVKDIDALSNLPSKEELISKIMFVINSGAQRLAVVTAGVARNLTIVIDQIRAQKESAGGGAPAAESAPAVESAPAAESAPPAESAPAEG